MHLVDQLPFEVSALEPHIDSLTMTIHHDKHHAAYVDNLNKLVEGTDFAEKNAWQLLTSLESLPEEKRAKIRNNAGGHANHTFFWKLLSPEFDQTIDPEVHHLIEASFGDFETFKKQFTEAALGRFGSGWAWLVLDSAEKLVITSTPNQDTPWIDGKDAILGIDVWEHAYYLKYQNRRADYVDAFFHVINWRQVALNLHRAQENLHA
jgi:Fe-Mn family superoxide dismutase